MMRSKYTIIIAFLFFCKGLQAESFSNVMEDLLYSSGKIHVVIGVVMIILILFFAYLIRLDRKISAMEKQIEDN